MVNGIRVDHDGDAYARRMLNRAREIAWERGQTRISPRHIARSSQEAAPWDERIYSNRADAGPTDDEPGPGLPRGKGRARASRYDPRLVKGDVTSLFARSGWEGRLKVASLVNRWSQIVGDEIASHCRVETFDEGKLVLRANSTAWAQQLRLLLPTIEAKIEQVVGEHFVIEVVILGPSGPRWGHGRRTVHGGRGPRDTYG